jgi:hypothetical protein
VVRHTPSGRAPVDPPASVFGPVDRTDKHTVPTASRDRRFAAGLHGARWRPVAEKAPAPQAVFPISAVLLIVTGLYMVRTSDEFKGATQPWAMTVLALLVVLSIVGAAFNGQRTKAIRLGLNAAPEGSIPVDLEARIHDPVLLTSILSMTSAILGAVMLMTIKPSSAVTCIIIAAAWLLAGALVAQPLTRSRPILAARRTEMTGSDSPI